MFNARKLLGVVLAAISARLLWISVANITALAGADWSEPATGGMALLAGVIVFVVAALAALGLATAAGAIAYLRGHRGRLFGALLVLLNGGVAATAFSESPTGVDALLWSGYAALVVAGLICVLLPGPRLAVTE